MRFSCDVYLIDRRNQFLLADRFNTTPLRSTRGLTGSPGKRIHNSLGIASDPKRLPELAFADADGKPRTLAAFQGKTVLLNLWATWCVPCRKEMPALDALQGKLGSDKFEVVAVNIDTRNLDKPKAWLREVGVDRLGYYADSSAKVFQDLKAIGKAIGMPTTLLIDPNGCELGTLAGPAEWASEDAVRLIETALGKS